MSDAEARAAGFDPAKGTGYTVECSRRVIRGGGADGENWVTTTMFVPTGEPVPAAPPPPDPQELADEAIAQLVVPFPEVHMGPNPNTLAVQIPVWLWIADPGQPSVTVAAAGLSVTATAKVTSTEWSMGEPAGSDPESKVSAASFSCSGLGQAPPSADVDRHVQPPCGYTYAWRSTPDRTAGSGTWRAQVTAHWTVTWVATNGANGALPLQSTSQVGVHVGEWRTVLVDIPPTR